jgi:translation initiation factor IF-2
MFDEHGNQIKTAGPSTPVVVSGWSEVPQAGDMFQVVKNERTARKMADEEIARKRSEELTVPTATERLTQLLESLRTAEHAELRIIVRADAHGSLEAIREAVQKISREDASVTVVHGAVGGITANDVMLAEVSEAVIYGFNARPDASARAAAKLAGIDIRTFSIIYELLDDIESLLVGELAPEEVESFLGVAEVRATFRAPRYGLVAGCYVTEGTINRNARARLVRDGVIVSVIFLLMGAAMILFASRVLPQVAYLPLIANVLGIFMLLIAPITLITTFIATVWPGSKKKLENCDH